MNATLVWLFNNSVILCFSRQRGADIPDPTNVSFSHCNPEGHTPICRLGLCCGFVFNRSLWQPPTFWSRLSANRALGTGLDWGFWLWFCLQSRVLFAVSISYDEKAGGSLLRIETFGCTAEAAPGVWYISLFETKNTLAHLGKKEQVWFGLN